ncbi:unnamed protein product [Closterium sp. Naga37s-1]|nr:unnamed protein product [Closterium sp. Naga37s-1]
MGARCYARVARAALYVGARWTAGVRVALHGRRDGLGQGARATRRAGAGRTGYATAGARRTGYATGWAGRTGDATAGARRTGYTTGWAGRTGDATGWGRAHGLRDGLGEFPFIITGLYAHPTHPTQPIPQSPSHPAYPTQPIPPSPSHPAYPQPSNDAHVACLPVSESPFIIAYAPTESILRITRAFTPLPPPPLLLNFPLLQLPVSEFPFIIAYAPTESILHITRAIIQPIGGVDIAPIVWLALISFLNEILLGQQGLLVLIANQESLLK